MSLSITGRGPKYAIRHHRPTAPLVLPRDDAAHYWAQLEWWYYVGHLKAQDGRLFGFELAFFKRLANEDHLSVLRIPVRWLKNVGFAYHFAVSDISGRTFSHTFLTNLLHDWQASPDGHHVALDGCFARREGRSFRLGARMRDGGIDLILRPTKGPVLHGKGGIVEKTDGNANYHYSYTNMNAEGTLRVQGKSLSVTGKAWMDHEYGTIHVGRWDWFCIQFDDDSELLLYAFRDRDMTIIAAYGDYIERDGSSCRFNGIDLTIRQAASWKSPKTGITYPVAWSISVKPLGLKLEVTSLLEDQELVVSPFPYWEGIIEVRGSRDDSPVRGYGYTELVGYGRMKNLRNCIDIQFNNVALP